MGHIIGSCDLMVTPVHDPDWHTWSSSHDGTSRGSNEVNLEDDQDAFEGYKAPAFKDYLKRGWCRLEMFFNANMPVKMGREKLFGGKLRELIGQGKRPHLVFGTREKDREDMPVILPLLEDYLFEKYHPGQGNLSNTDDKVAIDAYVEELFKINQNLKVRRMLCSHMA
jgi:hypothetical protein